MAAQQNNDMIFEESSRGGVSALTIVFTVMSFVLVFGGMVLSSFGFGHEFAWEIFAGGLLATTLGLILPLWVLPNIEK